MRTGCSVTVSRGGVCPGGRCLPREAVCPEGDVSRGVSVCPGGIGVSTQGCLPRKVSAKGGLLRETPQDQEQTPPPGPGADTPPPGTRSKHPPPREQNHRHV